MEASCLVVKDVKTGVLYNLFFKGTKPAIGTGIEFTGVPRDGVTLCMQGTPLAVSHGSRVDALKCATDQAPKSPTSKP